MSLLINVQYKIDPAINVIFAHVLALKVLRLSQY